MRDGATGVVVERLPPGQSWGEIQSQRNALEAYLHPIGRAQELDRHAVRQPATIVFSTDTILDSVVTSLEAARGELVRSDQP